MYLEFPDISSVGKFPTRSGKGWEIFPLQVKRVGNFPTKSESGGKSSDRNWEVFPPNII